MASQFQTGRRLGIRFDHNSLMAYKDALHSCRDNSPESEEKCAYAVSVVVGRSDEHVKHVHALLTKKISREGETGTHATDSFNALHRLIGARVMLRDEYEEARRTDAVECVITTGLNGSTGEFEVIVK